MGFVVVGELRVFGSNPIDLKVVLVFCLGSENKSRVFETVMYVFVCRLFASLLRAEL